MCTYNPKLPSPATHMYDFIDFEHHIAHFLIAPVASLEGNSTYPIPTVVPTGGINETKCEMSLPSVLVTFE